MRDSTLYVLTSILCISHEGRFHSAQPRRQHDLVVGDGQNKVYQAPGLLIDCDWCFAYQAELLELQRQGRTLSTETRLIVDAGKHPRTLMESDAEPLLSTWSCQSSISHPTSRSERFRFVPNTDAWRRASWWKAKS
jgi:hypothetical protein